jgi:hypothetical protein
MHKKKRKKKEKKAQESTGEHWRSEGASDSPAGQRRFDGACAIGHAGGIRRAWPQACRARASRRHRALLLK